MTRNTRHATKTKHVASTYKSQQKQTSEEKTTFNRFVTILTRLVVKNVRKTDIAVVLDDLGANSSKAVRNGTQGKLDSRHIFIANNQSPEHVARIQDDACGIATVKQKHMAVMLQDLRGRHVRVAIVDACCSGRTLSEGGDLAFAASRMSNEDHSILVVTYCARDNAHGAKSLWKTLNDTQASLERTTTRVSKTFENVAELVHVYSYNTMRSLFFVIAPKSYSEFRALAINARKLFQTQKPTHNRKPTRISRARHIPSFFPKRSLVVPIARKNTSKSKSKSKSNRMRLRSARV
jgi:hypothetical protein